MKTIHQSQSARESTPSLPPEPTTPTNWTIRFLARHSLPVVFPASGRIPQALPTSVHHHTTGPRSAFPPAPRHIAYRYENVRPSKRAAPRPLLHPRNSKSRATPVRNSPHFVVHHGLVPFSNGSRLNQPCSHPAASRSRSISRARNSRVFTEATVIPSASAVS